MTLNGFSIVHQIKPSVVHKEIKRCSELHAFHQTPCEPLCTIQPLKQMPTRNPLVLLQSGRSNVYMSNSRAHNVNSQIPVALLTATAFLGFQMFNKYACLGPSSNSSSRLFPARLSSSRYKQKSRRRLSYAAYQSPEDLETNMQLAEV